MNKALLVILVIWLAGCSSGNDYSQLIKGTWSVTGLEYTNPRFPVDSLEIPSYEIRFDDTAYFITHLDSKYHHSQRAKWKISDSLLTVITDGMMGIDTAVFKIILLNDRTLITESSELKWIFERKKAKG